MIALIIAVFCMFLTNVAGHGRLMDPPARNSMWRFGYLNPINYNDNELFCGGRQVQLGHNGGKCGVCGDNYADKVPRDHEEGGIYGNGIIGKRYITGQVIDVEADLTTNHWGWMELKFCPHNKKKEVVTQECFDRYPLHLADGSAPRFDIPEDSTKVETFKWKVKLPDEVTCTNCVIQWKYVTKNNWGTCSNGTEGIGCGGQETFVNCADVSVNTNTGFGGSSWPESNVIENPWMLFFRGSFPGVVVPESKNSNEMVPLVVRSQLCIPSDQYQNIPGMNQWCLTNCLKYPPNCHPDVCRCVTECESVGNFSTVKGSDIYCNQNCLRNPSVCPSDKCQCF